MYCHLKSYSVLWNHETSWNHNILFSVSLSVSFCMFPCSKGLFIRAELDTIQMTLLCPFITEHTSADTIQGTILFKGGNYLRKYGTSEFHNYWGNDLVFLKIEIKTRTKITIIYFESKYLILNFWGFWGHAEMKGKYFGKIKVDPSISCNSQVETPWISLIGWPLRTSSR